MCLSVCDRIFGTTRPIFTNFFVLVTSGRGSVVLLRRRDTLCTSDFMDDVIIVHTPEQLNVAAQLMEVQLTCSPGLGCAVNGA